jgi:hypothetical protein
MDGSEGAGTVWGMSTSVGNPYFDGILGMIGLPEPSVTDGIESELGELFAELGVTARLSSLRHGRIVIESDPTGAAILRFAKDSIRDRANGVASGAVETVTIRPTTAPRPTSTPEVS